MDQLTQLINVLETIASELKRSNDFKQMGFAPVDTSGNDTLTVEEAAKFIGVSKDTIYTMVRTNEIPHIKVRRRIFLRKSTLINWIQKAEDKLSWVYEEE